MPGFQQPSQGDQVKVAELIGCLALIWVREFREDIPTTFGEADAVAVDLHVLDGPKGGEKFENTLLFQRALIGSLKPAVGGEPVLGRIGQGVGKPGQSPPYILLPFTDADAQLATGYIARMAKPFQAPAAAGPPQPGEHGYTANPQAAAAAATPSPAAATPATANGAMTREIFDALPDEVQELLRQSGKVPA
jgi:hypothetical protein